MICLVEQYGARLASGACDRRIPDLAFFELYDGIPVSEIGDDGDMVALGHHDTAAAMAAFRARLAALGCDPPHPDDGLSTWISRKWAVTVTGGCRDGNCPPRARSSWHDDDGNCMCCLEIREQDELGGWYLDFGDDVTEATPGAFPITLCRA
ncbi:hypothetical protein WEI85_18090 [Actinomycetes bacterium KLBMP 9797]